MRVNEKKWIRFRIYLVAIFFLMGFGTVLARAYQLQILKKDHLQSIAREGCLGTTKLPSKRGTIYDRKGRELALSVEVASIYAHPKQIKEKSKCARHLGRILKQRQDKILRLLKSGRSFVWIERGIPPERARKLSSENLEGIGIATEARRYYPAKENGSHLIGFVGADNQGLEGLEKKYDQFLKGPQCSLVQMRDALGRPFSISRMTPSDKGMHDLILTIDKDIQSKAQQALRSAVKKARAKGGHCLAIDPETGEILAMALVPEFNPNIFFKYKPSQWRNRAFTDCYEPGSTIKAFLLAACLEEKVLTANTRIDCEQGKYKIGTHVIHDTKEQNILTVSDIIKVSSNIGAIKMGQWLGYATFYDYLLKFGFGNKTGSDYLGEREGFIRSVEKAKTIDQASLFFGQGMSATSLQIAMAMAAVANGGELMRPYVVKAIIDESGLTINETHPKVVRRVVSKRTARKTARILEEAVSEEGTGAEASIAGFRVAGKTGTSQKVDRKTKRYSWTKYVSTFVGFVPVDHPRLVILVTIDEPKGGHYGGLVAAPVFREVGQWALNYFRVNPEIRLATQSIHTRITNERDASSKRNAISSKQKKGTLPDFRGLGMRAVLKKARGLGLNVLLEGTGLAVTQNPKPGTLLERLNTVKVNFRPPTYQVSYGQNHLKTEKTICN